MIRFRSLAGALLLLCGALSLAACSPAESTAQTCQRLLQVQQEIIDFESATEGDPAQRVETVRGFALELDRIHDDAGDPQLEMASATLADMYRTIADVAAAHAHLTTAELVQEVGDHLEVDRINTANATYLRICEV